MKLFPSSRRWRALFVAFTVSALGTNFTAIAFYPRLQEIGGNATWFTILALAQAVPGLLIGPVAGSFADRGWRRRILVTCDLLSAVLIATVAMTGSLFVAVAAAAMSAASFAAFSPTEAVLEADLLDEKDLVRANGLRSWTVQLLATLGPAAAGSVLLFAKPRNALLIDCASFLVSALIVASTQRGDGAVVEKTVTNTSVSKSVVEAARFVLGDADLRLMFAASAVVYFLLGMQGPIIYSYLSTTFAHGGSVFGMMMTALGVGMLIASFLLVKFEIDSRYVVQATLAALVFDSIALFVFSMSQSVPLSAAMMFCMGAISATFMVLVRVYLQTRTPREMRGRIYGWYGGVMSPLAAASLLIVLPLTATVASGLVLRYASFLEMGFGIAGMTILLLRRPSPASAGSE